MCLLVSACSFRTYLQLFSVFFQSSVTMPRRKWPVGAIELAQRNAEEFEKLAMQIQSLSGAMRGAEARQIGNLQGESRAIAAVARYGLSTLLKAAEVNDSVPHCWPHGVRLKLLREAWPEITEDVTTIISSPELCDLVPCATPQSSAQLMVLGPPTGMCNKCQVNLSIHNKPTVVRFISATGEIMLKQKITLRCDSCRTNFGFDQFGSKQEGYRFYEQRRDSIVANDAVLVDRKVYDLQWAFAQHSWVSFIGFTESWHDAHGIPFAEGVDRRVLADCFWWGELEAELRESNLTHYRFRSKEDRENCMAHIDAVRSKSKYPHPEADCTKECKARGCGRLFVTDGIWKLQFPHCSFFVESVVEGIPLANLPQVCTNELLPGSVFCQFHTTACQARSPPIPTAPRAFAHFINGNGGQDDTTLEDNDDVEPVHLTDHSYAGSSINAIGGQDFLRLYPSAIPRVSSDCSDANEGCSKDLGKRPTLRKLSRGLQFVVRAGGHIDMWTPLYESESPSQVFIFLLAWLYLTTVHMSPPSWSGIILAYDNMCGLLKMRASRNPLPLPAPFDIMWASITKVIDSFHIRNHVQDKCQTRLHPKLVGDLYPELRDTKNTQAAEQTFVWLGRYKKIVASMPKTHHLFYIHRMVQRRNRYTVRCYQEHRKPILPGVRNDRTT